eukprot:2182392-Rhodomonas_salina.1
MQSSRSLAGSESSKSPDADAERRWPRPKLAASHQTTTERARVHSKLLAAARASSHSWDDVIVQQA